MKTRSYCVVTVTALLVIVILTGAKAWAQGPPYQTDDPVPVDLHHYEFYIFGGVGRHSGGDRLDRAGLRVQLGRHSQGAASRHSALGSGRSVEQSRLSARRDRAQRLWADGYGTGREDRLHQGDRSTFRRSARFTMFEMPTGNYDKGLGVGKVWYKLPIWLQKNIGQMAFDGGGGYQVVPQTGYRDFPYTGWLVKTGTEREAGAGSRGLCAWPRRASPRRRHSLRRMIDVGGYYHFKHHPANSFSFCYGHSIAGQTENYAYVGMYWTWGKDKGAKKEGRREGLFPGRSQPERILT